MLSGDWAGDWITLRVTHVIRLETESVSGVSSSQEDIFMKERVTSCDVTR